MSTVAFGAMTSRDPEVIRFAVTERGVDYVDTADCYMRGGNGRILFEDFKFD